MENINYEKLHVTVDQQPLVWSVQQYQQYATRLLDGAFTLASQQSSEVDYSRYIRSYTTESVYNLVITRNRPKIIRISEHPSMIQQITTYSISQFKTSDEFRRVLANEIKTPERKQWLTYQMMIVLEYLNKRMPMGDRIVHTDSGWTLFRRSCSYDLPQSTVLAVNRLLQSGLCYINQDNRVLYSRIIAINLLREYYSIRHSLVGIDDPPTSLMLLPEQEILSLIINQQSAKQSGGPS